jgi:polysaccharide chain length determinant protein (PEP-CTERM system associated)
VGLILTVTTVRSLSDVYASTTLIMVEPQDVPVNYVKPTITDRLEKRLQAMNQEVMSRTRLESIIKDFDLFAEMRRKGMPTERVVEHMRRKVRLQIFSAENAFRITYEGGDPNTVQRVTARLANLYIDENLRMREERAGGTTEFMEGELDKARRQLETLEAKVQEYRRQYMGELPEQQATNMNLLSQHQSQLRATSLSLSRTMERKLLLDKQAAEIRAARVATSSNSGGEHVASSPSVRVQQLEAQLAELRGRYTDEHPDVVHLQSLIAQLRSELGLAGTRIGGDPLLPPDLARAILDTQLEISRMRQEEDHLRKQITVYQGRVENAFVRNQEMESLTRDYDVTRRKYQTLLDKKLEAQLSQSLEQRQKAERFRVIDPASFPQSPARPNRPLFYAVGVALSVGLAIFLPVLFRQLDTSFHAPEELGSLAVPVLAVIPQLRSGDVQRRRLQYRLRVLGVSAVVLVVGLSTASFYAKYLY